MSPDGLRARMRRGDALCGTFVKTPDVQIVEVLAHAGLDFICFDAEHSPFDRGRLDACLAVAGALGLDALVRVPAGTPAEILKALDAGARGVVVPHCASVEMAESIAAAAHFGHGGRGFAGSTRWAGFGSRPMADVLAMDADTVVIGQIEEPEGVAAAAEIAAVEDIDGLFVGPADLAVCYGVTDIAGPEVRGALASVSAAARAAGKAAVTFTPTAEMAVELREMGVNMAFIGSEHSFLLKSAKETSAAFHA